MRATRVEDLRSLWSDVDGVDGGFCPVESDGKRTWMVRTPNGHYGNLANHDVIENEDGSITVHPSILVSNPQQGELYHGWLRNGEWTTA